nr:hypothetical protein [Tanacetum cinerariifolium]
MLLICESDTTYRPDPIQHIPVELALAVEIDLSWSSGFIFILPKDDDEDDVESDANDDNEASDIEKTDYEEDENLNLNSNDDEEEDDTEGSKQSSSISSDFTSKFLNLDNISPVIDEVASMMNFKSPHEESSTQAPPLLIVPVTAIPKTSNVATTNVPLIIHPFSSILQMTTPTIIPTTEPMNSSILDLPDFASLFEFDQRVTINESLENVVLAKFSSQPQLTYEASTSLTEFEFEEDPVRQVGERPSLTWINKTEKSKKPPTTFDELMSTPIDFSAYVLYNLKIENLTQEHLVGPTFILLKGTFKSRVEALARNTQLLQQKTKAAKYNNIEGIEDIVQTLMSPVKVAYDKHAVWGTSYSVTHVKVMKKYDYGYLDKIIVRREDLKLYKFKEGDFPRLNLHDIEDMLLLLVQKKLSNLEKDDLFNLNVALRMFTRHVVILKLLEDL